LSFHIEQIETRDLNRTPTRKDKIFVPHIARIPECFWPGDTTGLSTLSPTDIVASWGSDYPDLSGNQAEIYAANAAPTLP